MSQVEKEGGKPKPMLKARNINLDECEKFRNRKGKKLRPSADPMELEEHWFPNNTVKTNKYTVWNFFLLNLILVQMAKAPNVYFVIISVMQTIKSISISNG